MSEWRTIEVFDVEEGDTLFFARIPRAWKDETIERVLREDVHDGLAWREVSGAQTVFTLDGFRELAEKHVPKDMREPAPRGSVEAVKQ